MQTLIANALGRSALPDALRRPTASRRAAAPSTRTHAGPRRVQPKSQQPRDPNKKVPETGFFADVDPNATIYPVRSSLQQDVTKRGGRWTSDFVWNTNWAEQLDFEDSLRRQQAEGADEADASADGKGYLSLKGKIDLNSMDVDLSKQLMARRASVGEASSSAAAAAGGAVSSATKAAALRRKAGGYPAVPSTRIEQRGWERGSKFARRPVQVPASPAAEAAAEATAAADAESFQRLKGELQVWVAGLTGACLAATFAFYGRDVAASYGAGALGGIVYLNMLNKSLEGYSGDGGGAAAAAAGQPRLLIPVILTLAYNRYNTLLAPDTGLTLQLLPMLVGFFTYKGAVVARQSLALFSELSSGYSSGSGGGGSNRAEVGAAGGGGGGEAASVDRAFASKVLRG